MLMLDKRERLELWKRLGEKIEAYAEGVQAHRVAPELDPAAVRAALAGLDFDAPRGSGEALDFVVEMLWRYQMHTPHPMYFGLFNPAPATLAIAADALVAAFNPQAAAWSHSPFAVEAEQHLIRAFGAKFGFDQTEGTFCSGGTEANHTAVLAALTRAFPDFGRRGVRALAGQPVMYASSESHHSLLRAARVCGLGTDALRSVPVDGAMRIRLDALKEILHRDRKGGSVPFLVVGTAGSTNGGVIDPLPGLAELAGAEGLWFHVDAAWGGAAALSPKLRPHLAGIERADSITFDAHKWLSAPMGAGIFLTRHAGLLERAFAIHTDYMPRDARGLDVLDPYQQSLQWSRRFTGLKVLLPLMVAGWEGYRREIERMAALGDLMKLELEAAGWRIVNSTPLPVACFSGDADPMAVCARVVASGQAWISTTRLGDGGAPVLRACITNYRTGPEDVRALVSALKQARQTLAGTTNGAR